MAKSMYDIIKKQNGERFAKAIRNYDNGIFDIPDIDKIVKYAGRDAEPIMNYLVSLKQIKIQEMSVHMDPITLLDRAGYDAYIADTLEKQNAISKYYALGEELCTFRDDDRFKKYYIINAVRKDVDKIKRGNPPQRDDEYGTSVISIQVLKTGGFISIKNRYNHTVQNCDNTLNSNPDNIIMGLSDAIKHHFHVDFSAQHVPLPSHYVLMNGQICKYNSEIANVYFGEDFYAKDGQVHEIDKNSEIMIGNGILFDDKQKRFIDLTSMNDTETTRYRFVMTLNNAIQGKKITVQNNPLGGRDILADGVPVLTVENGEIVYINLPGKQDCIDLAECSNLRGEMDFSQVSNLILKNADLSAVDSLIMPKNADSINLEGAKLPNVDLDFSHVDDLNLKGVDLRGSPNIKLPKSGSKLNLNFAKLPAIDLDLRHYIFIGIYGANIHGADLSLVTGLQLPESYNLYLTDTIFPAIDIVLPKITHLGLDRVDLSRVTGLKLPKTLDVIELDNTKLPAIDLDFTDVRYVRLDECDLSRVTGLKGLKLQDMLRWGTARLKYKIKQSTQGRTNVQNTNNTNER